MIITGEMILLFLAIISALFSVVYFFWKEKEKTNATFSKIWEENNANFNELKNLISDIRENFVRHDVCEKRREKCPCVKDIEELKKVLNLKEKTTQ